MREVQPGMWHWTAAHPEWEPDETWEQTDVSSYAIDDGQRLLLFDPLALPPELEELSADRDTVIVLTNPWHERDARSISESLGAPVFAPPPDDGGTGERMPAQRFSAGDRLPFGVEVFPGREPPYDVLLWIEHRRTLVVGDTLVDRGRGLEYLPEWAAEEFPPEQVLPELRRLLDLPVELVLPTHGNPTDKAALERALS
jgi:glyoxylase-like metal-dependent hydrolase (beta-lactamase superfamily II)